jgi:hypothetical protein
MPLGMIRLALQASRRRGTSPECKNQRAADLGREDMESRTG